MDIRHFNSIGAHIFKIVMALYMVVAVSTTLLLIYEEYKSSREGVLRELNMFDDVFDSLLAQSLWAHDIKNLELDADGMLMFPIVSGVILSDYKNRPIVSRFKDEKNRPLPEAQGEGNDGLSRLKNLSFHFPVFFSDTQFSDNSTQDEIIGYVTVFAIENIEFLRIKRRVFFYHYDCLYKIYGSVDYFPVGQPEDAHKAVIQTEQFFNRFGY